MPEPAANLDQLFQSAIQHHQARRFAEAEQLYRQILARQPHHADALNMFGVLAAQVGRNDIGANLIRQAIAIKPHFAEAHRNLGDVMKGLGQLDEAIAAYRHAVMLRPEFTEAHYNLGTALFDTGKFDEAIAAYRQAIRFRPGMAEAHSNLGNALRARGMLDEAIVAYRQASALKSNFPEVHANLGVTLKDKGQLDEAIAESRRAIALRPDFPEAHNNLGAILNELGWLDEAIDACRRAIALRPGYAEAYNNLGNALKDKARFDEAIVAYRQAIALRPDMPAPFSNLGSALKEQGQLDAAVAAYRQAISLKPDYSEALNNLGTVLKDKGQLHEAIAACRQALVLTPDDSRVHSNLLLTLHYHPDFDASAIATEARRWDRRHAEPLRQFIQPHSNDRTPDRRLKIGYVSADFSNHVVGRFLLPLLSNHDRGNFEIVCYAQVFNPDLMTDRLRASADEWRSLVGLSNEAAADLVRRDHIDILIDLSLHTARNRLPIFARKPAPVQATYLAYAGTSGMSAMDYRLSDPYLDPPGMDESVYSERTIRLPQTYWCYRIGDAPAVDPLPAQSAGHITFGCFNNFCKVTEPTLSAWARILQAIPQSQLLLHAPEGDHRPRVAELFQKYGIQADRLRFVGKMPITEYFQLYQQIDIALDPFPFAGGTTTCDALYMGVPIVSLRGDTAVGRGGVSILSNLGLTELIARTTDEYIQIAAALANDRQRLSELRATLRGRMERSALMDAPRFARDIEAAYRQMWNAWCRAE